MTVGDHGLRSAARHQGEPRSAEHAGRTQAQPSASPLEVALPDARHAAP